jgi:hypothetical protein
MLETTNASLSLGQAMATELTEIGKCNGKTTAAMEYAQAVKHKQGRPVAAQRSGKFLRRTKIMNGDQITQIIIAIITFIVAPFLASLTKAKAAEIAAKTQGRAA